jgi:DNA-binding transcriptional LysR family regulator
MGLAFGIMRLRHIEACHAVFRTGAISRAAKLLGVSQPAASKLIKHAEQQLGFRLFERIRGRLVPTREAELLAPEVEKVFRQLEQLRRLGQNLVPSPQGRLRIGTIPSLGLSMLPRAIARFQQLHPAMRYEVRVQHTAELIESLMAQDLDPGFTFNAEPHVGIGLENLGSAELVYVRRGGDKAEIQLAEIDPQTTIGLMESDPIGRLLYRKLHSEKVAFSRRSRCRATTSPARLRKGAAARPSSTPSRPRRSRARNFRSPASSPASPSTPSRCAANCASCRAIARSS